MPTPERTTELPASSDASPGTTVREAGRPVSGREAPSAAPANPSGTRAAPSAAPGSTRPSLGERARLLLDEHLSSTVKFLIVGGLVFLLDAAMYNLLVFWHPTHGWGQGLMHGNPLTAKLLTIAAASCLTYLGNRLWTFGDRPRPDTTRSIMLFILVNVIATGLQLACLGFSRYVLGLDSPLADNISGTFIGQIVSTSFRYVTYGRLVFPKR
ncbi:GtrA family protein [Brachybacterium aquaticum]|uniref:GtrA family protein n=1 Tax=Brachybacterium aquaticum TaxID=1432564 RepID=UPI00161441BF|nr:GtrA family protein [Brachybacterium aquaticum]